jgi:hypothetical protein
MVHSASNRNKYQGISLEVNCGESVENSAILVVLNVKVRMEVQQSTPPPPSLQDLLWESFTFYHLRDTNIANTDFRSFAAYSVGMMNEEVMKPDSIHLQYRNPKMMILSLPMDA